MYRVVEAGYTTITEMKSRHGVDLDDLIELFQLIEAEQIEKVFQQQYQAERSK